MSLLLHPNVLIDKVAALLPALEERGPIYLFAFAQREDADRWDVVISSKWSDEDSAEAVRFIAAYMRPRFSAQDLTLISRIAVIPSSDPKVHELTKRWGHIVPKDNLVDYSKTISGEFLGSDIRLAFIFKSQPVPEAVPGKSLAEAGTVF